MQSHRTHTCRRFLYCIIFAIYAGISCAWAENATLHSLQLQHTAPDLNQLPGPGEILTLSVRTLGSNDVDLPVRAMITKDGKLMDLPMTIKVDRNETITYEIKLRAPLAEISYQFYLSTPDMPPVVSERFLLRRSCIPDVRLTDTFIDRSTKGDERARVMIEKADGLRRDLATYAQVFQLLDKIVTLQGGQ
jgi:hypothetical protein